MGAIPSSLERAHVEAAVRQIDREGVPARRDSTKFHLVVGKRRYPPKYVLSLAVAHATGRELGPHEFSGGEETNGVLRSLGFVVEEPGHSAPTPKAPAVSRALRQVSSEPSNQPARVTSDGLPIVRVVVRGRPASSPRAAGEMLLEAFGHWPSSGRAKFTVTPGGFVVGRFPSRWSGGVSWDSAAKDLSALTRAAQPVLDACLSKPVLARARTKTRVLTIGVDLEGDDADAELVAVVDCDSGNVVRWTGKSYPTGYQESRLVQVADVGSHLVEIADERVLVLGCHDLNMFSARARANQSEDGQRRQRCDAMAKAAARFKPTVVLQHPHSTDTPNIWRMPWACLTRDFPSVRSYASGIGYFRWNGEPRSSLSEVLQGTRSATGVFDVIVRSR